mgnify:CR=1 FL=1
MPSFSIGGVGLVKHWKTIEPKSKKRAPKVRKGLATPGPAFIARSTPGLGAVSLPVTVMPGSPLLARIRLASTVPLATFSMTFSWR